LKLFDLELYADYYYLKHAKIVQKIHFSHRTFYAKFEKVNQPLTPLLIKQHLTKQYTLATPLVVNNRVNYMLIEYKGTEVTRFYHFIQHLFSSEKIKNYSIYEGKNQEKLQVFIDTKGITLEEAHATLTTFSQKIKKHINSGWKCLPDITLPEEYNIATLPYKETSLLSRTQAQIHMGISRNP
jgi:hypothetical protein